MAKHGMRRFKPGNGMDSCKHYNKNEQRPVPELQGKCKQSNEKIEKIWEQDK